VGAPLNRQPLGLLDFLGIKNGGENPRELVNVLQPVLETGPLYLVPASSVAVQTTTITGTGLTLFGPKTQQDSRLWFFHEAGFYVDAAGAGDSAVVQLGIVDSLNQFSTLDDVRTISVAWGGDTVRGIWLGQGQALALRCHAGANFPHPVVYTTRSTTLGT